MKNKKGFTLIELMVSITILVLLIGIGTVSLNAFNANQKIKATRVELISNLKLARNYATTMQLPVGASGSLSYIDVTLANDGRISSRAKDVNDIGIGNTYFSRDVSPAGVNLSIGYSDAVNPYIRFAAYKGNLKNGNIIITISAPEVGTTNVVEISDSGLINEK